MKQIPNDIFFEEIAQFLHSGKNVKLYVKGTSMQPWLRNGKDAVMLSPVQPDALKTGNIVLFRFRGQYLLHRIIARRGDNFVMQGDGAYQMRESVTLADIIGTVYAIIRPSGKNRPAGSLSERLYWNIWYTLYPIRKYLLKITNKLQVTSKQVNE
jgi:signal peptidase I